MGPAPGARSSGDRQVTPSLVVWTPPSGPRLLFSSPSSQRATYGNDHHPPVRRLQTAQLHDGQEQEERPGPSRVEEILPLVPQAHCPPGNQVGCGGKRAPAQRG